MRHTTTIWPNYNIRSCLLLALPGLHPSPECTRPVPVVVNTSLFLIGESQTRENVRVKKPHSEGEFVKGASGAAAADKVKFFQSVRLSRRTVAKWISDIVQARYGKCSWREGSSVSVLTL